VSLFVPITGGLIGRTRLTQGLKNDNLDHAIVEALVAILNEMGSTWSRSGWLVTLVIVWPMALELVWLFIQTLKTQSSENNYCAA